MTWRHMTTLLKEHLNLWCCHYADKSCNHKHCDGDDIFFDLSIDLSWTHVKRIAWIDGCDPVTVSQHLVMLGGHWSSASEDVKYITCHMTLLRNLVIEGSSNFMSGSSSWYITHLAKLVARGVVVVEIKCF